MLNFLIYNKGILPLIKTQQKTFWSKMGSYLKKIIKLGFWVLIYEKLQCLNFFYFLVAFIVKSQTQIKKHFDQEKPIFSYNNQILQFGI